MAKNFANQAGYRDVPWLGLTYVMLLMQVVLAMLTQIHRKDQVTITVCALGFYMIEYAEITRRWQFRMLVALIFLSLVQDVLWFLLNRDVEDDDDDGGTEKKIKIFSRIMSFISMGWRVSNKAAIPSLLILYIFRLFYRWSSGKTP